MTKLQNQENGTIVHEKLECCGKSNFLLCFCSEIESIWWLGHFLTRIDNVWQQMSWTQQYMVAMDLCKTEVFLELESTFQNRKYCSKPKNIWLQGTCTKKEMLPVLYFQGKISKWPMGIV